MRHERNFPSHREAKMDTILRELWREAEIDHLEAMAVTLGTASAEVKNRARARAGGAAIRLRKISWALQ